MAREKCKACGADTDTRFYLCPTCGAKRPDEELLKRADMAYNADDSNAARAFYNGILADDPQNAQAYWGLFLLDHNAKDGILNKGPMKISVSAESYLAMNLTEELYQSIVSDNNFLRAAVLAEGELKKTIGSFQEWLEERRGEIERERNDEKFKARNDGLREYFDPSASPPRSKADDSDDIPTLGLDMGALFLQYLKDTAQESGNADKKTPSQKTSKSTKSKSTTSTSKKSTKSTKSAKPARATSTLTAGDWVAAVLCCLPTILELLLVILIPHIGFLSQVKQIAAWGWNALSVPLRVSFISLIVLGFGIQILGLFDKLNKPLGMATQLISFGLFIMSIYAASNNATSVYTLWGIALFVPVSLLIAALRYISADGFGWIDDFNFWYYLPIALEVAEYLLFFLVFPLMFGVSASLWMFIAITVTTIGAIAVSAFWEDFHWISVGINLAVAVLLCFIYWLGIFFQSEWLWNGGIITVVILAIGGSWFIHWFIHRNDP